MRAGSSEQARAELRRARDAGRVHTGYLLEGPAGTGKRETALWFARLLLCGADLPDPCERCRECVRSAPREVSGRELPAHPDLHWLEPEEGVLRIDQVRQLQRALGLVANEGGWRVGVLVAAESLRREAANALLKTLEEPPRRTTLVLVAERGEALPLTVRSRVVRLRFLPEAESGIARGLESEGLSPEDAWLVAALAGGSHRAAREWAARHLEGARGLREWLEEGERRSATEVLDFAESFRVGGEEGRKRTEGFLDVYAALARRRIEGAIAEGRAGSLERWLRRAERAAEARRELRRRNLNPQALVESLLLEPEPPEGAPGD
jgi:DNA polymerase-3 subunit delta'